MILNIISEQLLIPALNAASLAAIGVGIAWLKRKLHSEKNKQVSIALEQLQLISEHAVKSTEQTLVKALKKRKTWDSTRKREAKQHATNLTKAMMPKQTVQLLSKETSLDAIIENSIEANVHTIS